MASFDEAERRSKMVVPKSANDGKVVKLAPKKLTTEAATRTILPEENYLDNLEKIIVRDFFPELPKLKAQKEYLDAVDRKDVAKIRELQLRYHTQRRTDRRTSPMGTSGGKAGRLSTPGMASPAVFDPDTPGPSGRVSPVHLHNEEGDNESTLTADTKKKKEKNAVDTMTVNGYLNKFTSEDNASFEELAQIEERKERARNAWIYEAAEKHNQSMITRGEGLSGAADMQLALKYDPTRNAEKPFELDNWEYKERSAVLFYTHKDHNTAEERAGLNQMKIVKENTRIPANVQNQTSKVALAKAAWSLQMNQMGKVDVDGKERGISDKTMALLATPSPAPGVEDSPMMTWGEIAGTPFRLDAGDMDVPDTMPTFKIPEVPQREQLAGKITDQIARRYHDKRKIAMQAAEKAHRSPRFGSSRSSGGNLSSLSPAARVLATSKLGIRIGSTGSFGKPLTPSLSVRTPGSSRKTPGSDVRVGARTPVTAMVRRPLEKKRTIVTSSSITDNLLPIGGDEPEDDEPTAKKKTNSGGRTTAGDLF